MELIKPLCTIINQLSRVPGYSLGVKCCTFVMYCSASHPHAAGNQLAAGWGAAGFNVPPMNMCTGCRCSQMRGGGSSSSSRAPAGRRMASPKTKKLVPMNPWSKKWTDRSIISTGLPDKIITFSTISLLRLGLFWFGCYLTGRHGCIGGWNSSSASLWWSCRCGCFCVESKQFWSVTQPDK